MTRVDNWIIKACLTKAWAPPPIWKGMSKVCDLLHLCALIPLAGVGLPPESFHHQLLYLRFTCRKVDCFWGVFVNFIWFCGSAKATVKWGHSSAPRVAWNASLSQVCEDLGCGLQSSLHCIYGPWRQEVRIFKMSGRKPEHPAPDGTSWFPVRYLQVLTQEPVHPRPP